MFESPSPTRRSDSERTEARGCFAATSKRLSWPGRLFIALDLALDLHMSAPTVWKEMVSAVLNRMAPPEGSWA